MRHIGNIYSPNFRKQHDADIQAQINSVKYPHSVIELGTYLPIKQQVEMFKASGINLTALREANYDFSSGIADWRIEEYMDNPEFLNSLDADVATMLTRKMEILSQLQVRKERNDALTAEQKKAQAEAESVARKEAFERWYQAQKTESTASTSVDETVDSNSKT